jgi:hypothetical protein
MTGYELTKAMGEVVMSYVPTRFFLWSLWAYMSWLSLKERCTRRTTLLYRSVQNAFHSVQLRFYFHDEKHIPHIARHHEPYPLIQHGDLAWVYNPHEKEFVHVVTEEYSRKSLGILGATLCFAKQPHVVRGDLSEWISEAKVQGADAFVPYDVLVAAWCHDTEQSLHLPLSDYILNVTHLTGDEEVIRFARQET